MRYFKVSLYALQSDKIQSIKTIRQIFGWGLKESKDFVDLWWERNQDRTQRVVLNEVQLGTLLLERTTRANTDWGLVLGEIEIHSPDTVRDLSALGHVGK
jgi:hypothetical protein